MYLFHTSQEDIKKRSSLPQRYGAAGQRHHPAAPHQRSKEKTGLRSEWSGQCEETPILPGGSGCLREAVHTVFVRFIRTWMFASHSRKSTGRTWQLRRSLPRSSPWSGTSWTSAILPKSSRRWTRPTLQQRCLRTATASFRWVGFCSLQVPAQESFPP